MPVEPWNESGRVWEEDHGLLDAEQVARCQRADVAEPLRSPVPTRMISNGEYMPVPQTDAAEAGRGAGRRTRRRGEQTGSASAGGSSCAARAAWRPRCSP